MHAVLSVDGSFQEQDLESRMRILEGNLELCLQKKKPSILGEQEDLVWFSHLKKKKDHWESGRLGFQIRSVMASRYLFC